LRIHPPHDLLGSRITGGNPLEPTWRKILKVENLPWFRDHIIDGSIIFPDSGCLCLAVEALRQQTLDRQPGIDIRQFVLRDVVFSKALPFPETPSKVEIQVGLRPLRISHLQHSAGWSDFWIYSMTSDGVWNENCRGSVIAELKESTNEDGDFMGDDVTMLAQKQVLNAMESWSFQDLSADQIFQSNPVIEKHIQDVEATFQASIIKSEWLNCTCPDSGNAPLKRHGYGGKSGFQMVIQLASRMYFGSQHPSWETVTMRSFHKGRVNIIQSVLPPVASFCAAMCDVSTTSTKRRELFHEATRTYTNALTRISRGRGFAHHLYALREVLRDDEDTPLLFQDPTYARTRPGKIMTDCTPFEGAITEGGVEMPDSDFVWVHYEVDEER
ncbi:MAG: hypothetical protein LQ345_006164, partial [Seirophora villosa]